MLAIHSLTSYPFHGLQGAVPLPLVERIDSHREISVLLNMSVVNANPFANISHECDCAIDSNYDI